MIASLAAASRASRVRRGFPLLTAMILVPAVGAVLTLLLPARRPELIRVARLRHQRGDVRPRGVPADPVRHRARRATSSCRTTVDAGARHPVDARRRRHQPVHGRAHRAADPDQPPRVGGAREAEVVHVLDAAARGVGDRRVHRARRDRVLRLLRARARADVLPHRGLGPRQPALRGGEVLPVHRRRLGVPLRRDPVGRVPAPARHRPPHVQRAGAHRVGVVVARAVARAPRSGCSSRSRSASR